MNTKTEQALTSNDEVKLREISKAHIKAWLFLVRFIFLMAIVLAAAVLVFSYWKGNSSIHIEQRILWVSLLPVLVLIFLLWQNLKPYQDLRRGKKYVYILQEYKLKDIEDQLHLTTQEKGLADIPLEERFRLRIARDKPLHIEVTPKSQQLLFLSQDGSNWLEEEVQ